MQADLFITLPMTSADSALRSCLNFRFTPASRKKRMIWATPGTNRLD
jgi:hypothetical protein